MSRALRAVVLVMMAMVLVWGGPAGAAAGKITHQRFHGAVADADWFVATDTSVRDTYVNATHAKKGSSLYVVRFRARLDSNGEFAGAKETIIDVTTGFTFDIDAAKLSSAKVTGTDLPARTCFYDANWDQPKPCQDGTLDLKASWTGQGSITRGVTNEHVKGEGFSYSYHSNGKNRAATAKGWLGTQRLRAAALDFGQLAVVREGSSSFCVGANCQ
ncbi:hypothetical protein [Nocardioides mesophilus]|uniref:Uncharacterized protein n=1 Tax=Nocardioides mesophilus TaxID=433659 RepID=A0A7G9RE30_9ACTN|nr:hypothetical protein [Nocardioides mesophilus]QNN53855.1 hypothetical protein H9L09_05520 [Nocardioides mesophilus]